MAGKFSGAKAALSGAGYNPLWNVGAALGLGGTTVLGANMITGAIRGGNQSNTKAISLNQMSDEEFFHLMQTREPKIIGN